MSLFQFSEPEALAFFCVLTRFATLVAVLPLVGDRFIPGPAKILLALAVTTALFPSLVARGLVRPADAALWGSSAGALAGTVAVEALFGLLLGFVGKLVFDTVLVAGNLIGGFMGFAAASTYDPHQESHSQVVAEILSAVAMLLFLVLDGHHLMLDAALGSYAVVGLGGFASAGGVPGGLVDQLLSLTGETFRSALQLSAPMAVSLFAVNLAIGVAAKAMPQLNILVLSFGLSAFAGLVALGVGFAEFGAATGVLLEGVGEKIALVARLAGG